ncbi:MAG: phytoene desaturase family protein [Balneolaceae bacterium]
MNKEVITIGAGLGGLAASALLATLGYKVTLFEKNDSPGGKMNQINANGYRFDTGPSLLTMPEVLDTLFKTCGKKREDYLQLEPVTPLCRYFYPDGIIFDNYQDTDKTIASFKKFAPGDQDNYRSFLRYAARLYDKTAGAFLLNPLYDTSDLKLLKFTDFFEIDAFSTVASRINRQFDSPYLRQFFKRFTTYNGSSPFQAPATMNVISHVEINMGGFYVKGGLYKIALALEKLALEQGVDIHYGKSVQKINCNRKSVKSVLLEDGKEYQADIIVSNSDASETILNLLDEKSIPRLLKKKQKKLEPSCSGFVLLLGIEKKYENLVHHNIFFSSDYKREFEMIFKEKQLPDDPTIYVANTSYSEPGHAPAGHSNLFLLVNAPYLAESQDWDSYADNYPDILIRKLEKAGLAGLRDSIRWSGIITPEDFQKKYRSNKGSIYGTSSNSSLSAFNRPKNKVSFINGLYMVGGSTHPGGGIPLVLLSAFHATELIRRYE